MFTPQLLIRFSCPHCFKNLLAVAARVGMAPMCPACHKELAVPTPDLVDADPTPIGEPSMSRMCVQCYAVFKVEPALQTGEIGCPNCGHPDSVLVGAPGTRLFARSLPLRFDCPRCSKKLVAKSSRVGKSVKCPACSKGLVVPALVEADLTPPAEPFMSRMCAQCGEEFEIEPALRAWTIPCPSCGHTHCVLMGAPGTPLFVRARPEFWWWPSSTNYSVMFAVCLAVAGAASVAVTHSPTAGLVNAFLWYFIVATLRYFYLRVIAPSRPG